MRFRKFKNTHKRVEEPTVTLRTDNVGMQHAKQHQNKNRSQKPQGQNRSSAFQTVDGEAKMEKNLFTQCKKQGICTDYQLNKCRFLTTKNACRYTHLTKAEFEELTGDMIKEIEQEKADKIKRDKNAVILLRNTKLAQDKENEERRLRDNPVDVYELAQKKILESPIIEKMDEEFEPVKLEQLQQHPDFTEVPIEPPKSLAISSPKEHLIYIPKPLFIRLQEWLKGGEPLAGEYHPQIVSPDTPNAHVCTKHDRLTEVFQQRQIRLQGEKLRQHWDRFQLLDQLQDLQTDIIAALDTCDKLNWKFDDTDKHHSVTLDTVDWNVEVYQYRLAEVFHKIKTDLETEVPKSRFFKCAQSAHRSHLYVLVKSCMMARDACAVDKEHWDLRKNQEASIANGIFTFTQDFAKICSGSLFFATNSLKEFILYRYLCLTNNVDNGSPASEGEYDTLKALLEGHSFNEISVTWNAKDERDKTKYIEIAKKELNFPDLTITNITAAQIIWVLWRMDTGEKMAANLPYNKFIQHLATLGGVVSGSTESDGYQSFNLVDYCRAPINKQTKFLNELNYTVSFPSRTTILGDYSQHCLKNVVVTGTGDQIHCSQTLQFKISSSDFQPKPSAQTARWSYTSKSAFLQQWVPESWHRVLCQPTGHHSVEQATFNVQGHPCKQAAKNIALCSVLNLAISQLWKTIHFASVGGDAYPFVKWLERNPKSEVSITACKQKHIDGDYERQSKKHVTSIKESLVAPEGAVEIHCDMTYQEHSHTQKPGTIILTEAFSGAVHLLRGDYKNVDSKYHFYGKDNMYKHIANDNLSIQDGNKQVMQNHVNIFEDPWTLKKQHVTTIHITQFDNISREPAVENHYWAFRIDSEFIPVAKPKTVDLKKRHAYTIESLDAFQVNIDTELKQTRFAYTGQQHQDIKGLSFTTLGTASKVMTKSSAVTRQITAYYGVEDPNLEDRIHDAHEMLLYQQTSTLKTAQAFVSIKTQSITNISKERQIFSTYASLRLCAMTNLFGSHALIRWSVIRGSPGTIFALLRGDPFVVFKIIGVFTDFNAVPYLKDLLSAAPYEPVITATRRYFANLCVLIGLIIITLSGILGTIQEVIQRQWNRTDTNTIFWNRIYLEGTYYVDAFKNQTPGYTSTMIMQEKWWDECMLVTWEYLIPIFNEQAEHTAHVFIYFYFVALLWASLSLISSQRRYSKHGFIQLLHKNKYFGRKIWLLLLCHESGAYVLEFLLFTCGLYNSHYLISYSLMLLYFRWNHFMKSKQESWLLHGIQASELQQVSETAFENDEEKRLQELGKQVESLNPLKDGTVQGHNIYSLGVSGDPLDTIPKDGVQLINIEGKPMPSTDVNATISSGGNFENQSMASPDLFSNMVHNSVVRVQLNRHMTKKCIDRDREQVRTPKVFYDKRAFYPKDYATYNYANTFTNTYNTMSSRLHSAPQCHTTQTEIFINSQISAHADYIGNILETWICGVDVDRYISEHKKKKEYQDDEDDHGQRTKRPGYTAKIKLNENYVTKVGSKVSSKPRILTAIQKGIKLISVCFNHYNIEFMKYQSKTQANLIFAPGLTASERTSEVGSRIAFFYNGAEHVKNITVWAFAFDGKSWEACQHVVWLCIDQILQGLMLSQILKRVDWDRCIDQLHVVSLSASIFCELHFGQLGLGYLAVKVLMAGLTFSGHPLRTTVGNSWRMQFRLKYIADYLDITDQIIMVGGDDVVIFFLTKESQDRFLTLFRELASTRPGAHQWLNIVVKELRFFEIHISNFQSMHLAIDNSGIYGQSRQLMKMVTNIWICNTEAGDAYWAGRSIGIAKQQEQLIVKMEETGNPPILNLIRNIWLCQDFLSKHPGRKNRTSRRGYQDYIADQEHKTQCYDGDLLESEFQHLEADDQEVIHDYQEMILNFLISKGIKPQPRVSGTL